MLACGIQSPGVAVLWLQNRDSCWYNHAGRKVPPVDSFRVALEGLPDGKCRVEWWTTWQSRIDHVEEATVTDGRLTLSVPPLKTDVALKIVAGK